MSPAADALLDELIEELTERLLGGDRTDVEAFLAAHPEHAAALRALLPTIELMARLGHSPADESSGVLPPGDNPTDGLGELGDFRLICELGRGGMGIVYEAEQVSLGRRVALKLLPMAAAMDPRQIQRFRVEAQAAACLHHPHIVPVHGVGCERGVHYYAMQLIDGRSLAAMIAELRRRDGLDPGDGPALDLAGISTTDLAARLLTGGAAGQPGGAGSDAPTVALPASALPPQAPAPLLPSPLTGEGGPRGRMRGLPDGQKPPAKSPSSTSTRNREYVRNVARLAMQAAEALDHAHARGILHRDIKPANLLLDAQGRLWVTDFGLAQVRGDDRLTLTGDVLGTLRYMSPEQALGRRVVVDGRTDLYSLGVTLYELLTLCPAVDGRDRAEILRKVAEEEPTPLRRLNPAVPADLETIVLKTTAKDPTSRYATAQELAEDLRNYLEDRPIRARRPGLLDRAGKWSRRHRAVMTTAALLLVLGTAVSAWQAMKAREAAAEASQRAEESRQVVDYLAKDIFGGAAQGKKGKKRSRSVTVGELLDGADATLGERFRGQPLVEAGIRMALAQSYIVLFMSDRAEQNAARAAQLRERYLGPEYPATLEALALQAWILNNAVGTPEQYLHKTRAAEPIARRVLAARRRVLGPAHPDTLATQADLAHMVSDLGRHEEAEDLAAQAEALGVRFLGPENEVTINARFALGRIAQRRGDLARAEALLRQVVAAIEQGFANLDHLTLYALEDLACTVRLQGRAEEARLLRLEAANRFAQFYGLCHIRTSGPIGRLLSLLKEQRDYTTIRDFCEGWLRELLAMPPEPDHYERSRRSIRLSQLVLTVATLPEPIPFDGELAVRAAEQAAAQGDDTVDNNWTRLSLVHLRLGQIERAEWAVRESMKRRNGGDRFDWLAQALIHTRRGELDLARTWFHRAAEADDGGNAPGVGYGEVHDELATLLGLPLGSHEGHRPGPSEARDPPRGDGHRRGPSEVRNEGSPLPRGTPSPDKASSDSSYKSERRSK
jgi:eukaryotic-like serine/threonine-protein kinase